jgi:hypothetical protein
MCDHVERIWGATITAASRYARGGDGSTSASTAESSVNLIGADSLIAEPWLPPHGMAKRRCPSYGYFFATPLASEPASCCPNCATADSRTPREPG